MTFSTRILSNGPEQTRDIGRSIGESARAGDVFLLVGPLGAGKTCLTQGIAEGLGVSGYVRSPTFVLTTQYEGRLRLFHLDLYRIDAPLEAWDLGLDEQLFGEDVCVVEWADRAPDIFPEESLWVSLDHVGRGDNRMLEFSDWPDRFEPVLSHVADGRSISESDAATETES